MRGERDRIRATVQNGHRFIPACAGNAECQPRMRHRAAVHPRMRGERWFAGEPKSYSDGSSPHARGTRCHHGQCSAHGRFIPACAGNAHTSQTVLAPDAVHPRMRGERNLIDSSRFIAHGSSPHARGTLFAASGIQRFWRFIPACAGNAKLAGSSSTGGTVHPRMRGERLADLYKEYESTGSSPHARGTPRGDGMRSNHVRFIPACAGNATSCNCRCRLPSVHPRMRGERWAPISN